MESYHSKGKKWNESDSHWNFTGSNPLSKRRIFNFYKVPVKQNIFQSTVICRNINFPIKLLAVKFS